MLPLAIVVYLVGAWFEIRAAQRGVIRRSSVDRTFGKIVGASPETLRTILIPKLGLLLVIALASWGFGQQGWGAAILVLLGLWYGYRIRRAGRKRGRGVRPGRGNR